jgi:ethanolamine permease
MGTSPKDGPPPPVRQEIQVLPYSSMPVSERKEDDNPIDDESLDEENVIESFNGVQMPKVKIKNSTDVSNQIAGYWDLLSFGVCVVAVNIVFGWPVALARGFWPTFFGNIFTSLLFICLHLCIGEMISILPFSGGSYGFARVTVGPYIGFLVGCYESISNIVYSFTGMIPLAKYFTYIIDGDPRYEPVYWIVLYVLILINEYSGRVYYFRMLRTAAFLSVVVYVLYIFVSIPNIDTKRYIPTDSLQHSFPGGVFDLLGALPFTAFFFVGMEMMPLVSDEMKNPREDGPKAVMTTVLFLTGLSFLLIFLVFCQAPSYPYLDMDFAQDHILALNSGFSNGFGISDQAATIFSYPLLFISSSVYIYGFSKQLKALGNSHLLPAHLGKTLPNTKVPYFAVLLGCFFSFFILLISYFINQDDTYSPMMYNIYAAAIMGTYFVYLMTFISFIVFQKKYPTLERKFRNPWGTPSAVYGILILIVLLVIVVGYSSAQFDGLKIFVCFTGIMSLYYFCYARYQQTFSEEEQKVLFVVYLINGEIYSEFYFLKRFSNVFFQ